MKTWVNFHCPNIGQATALERIASARPYGPATELFRQSTPAREVYLIRRGLVKLSYVGRDRRELILSLRSENWIVGASAALAQKPHATTGVTLTRCEISPIEAEKFLGLMKSDAGFAVEVARMLGHEECEQTEERCRLRTHSSRERVERLFGLLVDEGEEKGRGKERSAPMALRHREIAGLVGISAEYLSRLLKEMEREGVARIESGMLVVPEIERLIAPEDG